jgi:adenosylcobyric acid synthase
MVVPTAEMNPILLKPEVDYRSQLIVLGRPRGRLESRNFNRRKEDLWEVVTESLDRVRSEFEVVVIEGAGSPAEINLRRGDIVNMEVALYAGATVLLVGDIDKGGVFASLYGTMMLLAPEERELVLGTVINMRGDVSILLPGLRDLEALTGVPVLGVVPYFRDIYVPEEDSPAARDSPAASAGAVLDVVVVALPHIANFDDFDPLAREPGVALRYVRTRDELGSPDLVIMPRHQDHRCRPAPDSR